MCFCSLEQNYNFLLQDLQHQLVVNHNSWTIKTNISISANWSHVLNICMFMLNWQHQLTQYSNLLFPGCDKRPSEVFMCLQSCITVCSIHYFKDSEKNERVLQKWQDLCMGPINKRWSNIDLNQSQLQHNNSSGFLSISSVFNFLLHVVITYYTLDTLYIHIYYTHSYCMNA